MDLLNNYSDKILTLLNLKKEDIKENFKEDYEKTEEEKLIEQNKLRNDTEAGFFGILGLFLIIFLLYRYFKNSQTLGFLNFSSLSKNNAAIPIFIVIFCIVLIVLSSYAKSVSIGMIFVIIFIVILYSLLIIIIIVFDKPKIKYFNISSL